MLPEASRNRQNAGMPAHEIRYARSGAVESAYEIAGEGPIDIVYVAGFISHLDLAAELSPFRSLLGRLRRFARVLAFDKRGTGCSGRELGFGSLEERSDDIRVVMDHAGWQRAHLIGISEGGPLSLLFAAKYPERVEGLALFGSFACLLPPEDPQSATFDVAAFLAAVEAAWGTGATMGAFTHAPSDEEAMAQLGRYERGSASPSLAAQILRHNMEIDARGLLGALSVPTIVVHRTGDPVVGVQRGRELAAGLAGAQYVEIPGDFHCAWNEQEWAPAIDPIEEFLTGDRVGVASPERMLATVLFTDIVDSTGRAAASGDRVWRELLDEHDATTARVVQSFGGRIVKHTGDGVVAVLDGPARGVQCAQSLRAAIARTGLSIRAGIHTGEVERRGEDIGGIGVHIGARVGAQAAGDEILVSRTVRDLVVGSDLRFEDRGEFALKGVPDAWRLYRVVD
jgi:pimeloyl-ACP methyl ester carboxylesterase/class 3 adenylate cyclase